MRRIKRGHFTSLLPTSPAHPPRNLPPSVPHPARPKPFPSAARAFESRSALSEKSIRWRPVSRGRTSAVPETGGGFVNEPERPNASKRRWRESGGVARLPEAPALECFRGTSAAAFRTAANAPTLPLTKVNYGREGRWEPCRPGNLNHLKCYAKHFSPEPALAKLNKIFSSLGGCEALLLVSFFH